MEFVKLFPSICSCGRELGKLQATIQFMAPEPIINILEKLEINKMCCRKAILTSAQYIIVSADKDSFVDERSYNPNLTVCKKCQVSAKDVTEKLTDLTSTKLYSSDDIKTAVFSLTNDCCDRSVYQLEPPSIVKNYSVIWTVPSIYMTYPRNKPTFFNF